MTIKNRHRSAEIFIAASIFLSGMGTHNIWIVACVATGLLSIHMLLLVIIELLQAKK